MDCGHSGAVESGIELAPFADGNGRAGCKPHRLQHAADDDGIDREHFAEQGDGGSVFQPAARALDRAFADFLAGIG